ERADARGVRLSSAAADQTLVATGPTGSRTATYPNELLDEDLVGVLVALNPAPPHTYAYDARGNRTSRTKPDGTTTYAYDQADRLVGVDSALSYRYDGDGLRAATTGPSGTRRFSWSKAGGLPMMLTDTPLDAGGAAMADRRVSYVYGPGGRVLTRIDPRPDISLLGARATADAGLGDEVTVQLPPGVEVQDQILLSVTYDKNGTVPAPPAGYEEVGTRIGQNVTMKLWRRTATGGEASVTVRFGSITLRAAAAAVYRGVDPSNPVVDADFGAADGQSVTVPSLDASGPGDHLVAFPGETQLVPGATTWTHPPGMAQQAAAAAPNAAAAVSDQALAAAGPTGDRAFGFASPANLVAAGVVLRRGPNQERWYRADQLGSTRLLTDQAGRTVGTASYDPYGAVVGSTGERSDVGFAGEYTDPTTGLVYLRARWYDPATAQFMSRDPLLEVSGQPYAYAANDPVNRTDPTGELPLLAAMAVGALVGGATDLGLQMLGNAFRGCGLLDNINWGQVAVGAALGAITGGRGHALKAPQTAARIGDDVVRSADDAFTHGYSYHPRIRARGVQDPVGHNFPYSYDDVILRSTPVRQADGSLLYRSPGSINGKDGFFEMAVNTDTGTIFHRTFVGG
ncbi:MAG: RHS repeat-associated core domain-containing protein, partial [Acidimicrobiales bacterium]